jgi:hypothetical protein
MKFLRWVVFFCGPALLLAQPPLRLKVPPQGPEVYQEPPASGRIHIIVQFPTYPTGDTLLALTARGANLLQYVPDYGVLVNIGVNTDLTSLGLHYAGSLTPQQKISPLIVNGDPTVIRGNYLVEFHSDVDTTTARRILLSLPNVVLVDNPDLLSRHFLVNIPDLTREAEALAALAAQDEVEYVFPASSELIQGLQVFALSDTLNQNILTTGDGWDGPGLNAVNLSYFFSHLTAQLPESATKAEILRAMANWASVAQINWLPGTSATACRARALGRRCPLRRCRNLAYRQRFRRIQYCFARIGALSGTGTLRRSLRCDVSLLQNLVRASAERYGRHTLALCREGSCGAAGFDRERCALCYFSVVDLAVWNRDRREWCCIRDLVFEHGRLGIGCSHWRELGYATHSPVLRNK